ncbi:MAG: hypothetical protein EB060_04660 [Proteobacteria bacterium]|nr:hypothetical protein [Pseudomonadota bacterium]
MANDADILYLIGRLARLPEMQERSVQFDHGYAELDAFMREIAERGFEYGYDLSNLDLAHVPHPVNEGQFVDLMPALSCFTLPRLNLQHAKLTYAPNERLGEEVDEDNRMWLPTIVFSEGTDLTQAEIVLHAPVDVQKNLNLHIMFATSVYPPRQEKSKQYEEQKVREPRIIIADRLRLPEEYRSVQLQVDCPVDFTTLDLKEYVTPGISDPEGRAAKYTARFMQADPAEGGHPNTVTFKQHVFIHSTKDTIMRGCHFLPQTVIHLEQPSGIHGEKPPLIDLDFAKLSDTRVVGPEQVMSEGEAALPRFTLSMRYAEAENMKFTAGSGSLEWQEGSIAGGNFEYAQFKGIHFRHVDADSANLQYARFSTCNAESLHNLRGEQLISTYIDDTTLLTVSEEVRRRIAHLRQHESTFVLTPKLEEYILTEFMPTIVLADKNPEGLATLLDKLEQWQDIGYKERDQRTAKEQLTYDWLGQMSEEEARVLRHWVRFLKDYPVRYLKEETTEQDEGRIASLSPRIQVVFAMHMTVVAGHVTQLREERERLGPEAYEARYQLKS